MGSARALGEVGPVALAVEVMASSVQRLVREFLYFCTSKASKLSRGEVGLVALAVEAMASAAPQVSVFVLLC